LSNRVNGRSVSFSENVDLYKDKGYDDNGVDVDFENIIEILERL
jgi:hypothetical protein